MTEERPAGGAPQTPRRPSPLRRVLALVRNAWRGLVSMRTALVLLFLLALASIPGALLPQRSLNAQKVDDYVSRHTVLGPVFARVGLFEVFASPWFAAIYVLLFISLIGCLLPRLVEHARALRARPVAAPRNLGRLPHHHTTTVDADVDEVAARVAHGLRRWRTATTRGADGSVVVSAERGYLRELGNLVFHFSLVGLLVGIAVGKLFGYEGQVVVIADGQGFCNTSTSAYDAFRAGLEVDGTGLEPFCVRVDDFSADYLPTGQAAEFLSRIDYQHGADLATDTWRPYDLKVNDPLRIGGDRVYLLGHGYAPQFTVTFPNGESRTEALQFRPVEGTTLLSDGTLRIDPPAGLYPTEDARRANQIAITGLFAPTANLDGTLLTSSFPAPNDPAVAVDVYRGDTGLDTGTPQNIYALDPTLAESGRLVKQARVNLKPGESTTLDDGTQVRFDQAQQWVSLQTSHDPGQVYVLLFAVTMTAGLLGSLLVKRRRVWVRLAPDPARPDGASGRTVVELGGLARTDQAGWGEEFDALTTRLLSPADDDAGDAAHADRP
ncbi:cytochrome c biogenesis protein ResB [Rhodococcus aerolatus]